MYYTNLSITFLKYLPQDDTTPSTKKLHQVLIELAVDALLSDALANIIQGVRKNINEAPPGDDHERDFQREHLTSLWKLKKANNPLTSPDGRSLLQKFL